MAGMRPELMQPALQRLRKRPLAAPPALRTPLVSAVIVNYRRWDETAALVDQLVQPRHIHGADVEVIVVDNDSQPDPLEEQLKQKKGVRVLRQPRNVGFSAGVNAGYQASRGDWVLVLNPDVVVCRGFVDLLCGAARDLRDDSSQGGPVGVVGFHLQNCDGSRQLSTGRFPNLFSLVLGLLRPRQTRTYFRPTPGQRQQVPWVTGSCLLIRRECLQALGGFDEDYFLYYEDVDLCRRAADLGWGVCYEPGVMARHMEPLQNRQLTEPLRAVTRHAAMTYFRKHLSDRQFRGLTRIVRLEAKLRRYLHLWRGNRAEAEIMQCIGEIATLMQQGQIESARQTLEHVLRLAGMARLPSQGPVEAR
jgi:N-acetylglucosaminyl-diphospho-decaprenol L-rhamnosyltransferase